MSRLSDVIARVIEQHMTFNGRLAVHDAVTAAMGLIDDEDRDRLVEEALGKRIKDAAGKGAASVLKSYETSSPQLPFPNLRPAHALDIDGRIIKRTADMTEIEFCRLIEIRKKQVADDKAYLDELTSAYAKCRPYWQAHPEWTFGDVARAVADERVA